MRKRASTFVIDQVLSQFRRRPADITSPGKVGDRLAAWLLGLGHPELHIVYDYSADFELLERWLRVSIGWHKLGRMLVPSHVGYLGGKADAVAASAASWKQSFVTERIGRHHALADARALRQAFVAVHGN